MTAHYCALHNWTGPRVCPDCALLGPVCEDPVEAQVMGEPLPSVGVFANEAESKAPDFYEGTDGLAKRARRLETSPLIVTKDGVPFEDQAEGVREFKEACLAAADKARSANDRQIGGEHYKVSGLQHWDLVAVFNMDYYKGNATKYLSRGHKKNGRQDYAKAVHYIDKRIELGYPWTAHVNELRISEQKEDAHAVLWDFVVAQEMPTMAIRAFFAIMQGRPEDARHAAAWLADNYQ